MELTAIIALVSAALGAVEKGMAYLDAKKINREMTPEEEAAYDKLVQDKFKSSHWRKSTG